MIDSNNTSMEITNNYSILSKIVKFIKNIFKKDNIKYITEGKSDKQNNRNDNPFFKSIKFGICLSCSYLCPSLIEGE